ncbi:MAG: flotillin-like FloA family protein [Reichenbachiella sp.]
MSQVSLIVIVGVLLVILVKVLIIPTFVYFRSNLLGVSFQLINLIQMQFKISPMSDIIDTYILLNELGVTISIAELEIFVAANGSLVQLVKGLLRAKRDGIEVSLLELQASGVSGGDIDSYLDSKG